MVTIPNPPSPFEYKLVLRFYIDIVILLCYGYVLYANQSLSRKWSAMYRFPANATIIMIRVVYFKNTIHNIIIIIIQHFLSHCVPDCFNIKLTKLQFTEKFVMFFCCKQIKYNNINFYIILYYIIVFTTFNHCRERYSKALTIETHQQVSS